MAQSTILSANTTTAVSSDVVVEAGSVVTVGLFSSVSSNVPNGAKFNVLIDTPGSDTVIAALDNAQRVVVLTGPGTYRVSRRAYSGAAFGVFLET